MLLWIHISQLTLLLVDKIIQNRCPITKDPVVYPHLGYLMCCWLLLYQIYHIDRGGSRYKNNCFIFPTLSRIICHDLVTIKDLYISVPATGCPFLQTRTCLASHNSAGGSPKSRQHVTLSWQQKSSQQGSTICHYATNHAFWPIKYLSNFNH